MWLDDDIQYTKNPLSGQADSGLGVYYHNSISKRLYDAIDCYFVSVAILRRQMQH